MQSEGPEEAFWISWAQTLGSLNIKVRKEDFLVEEEVEPKLGKWWEVFRNNKQSCLVEL